MSTLPPNFVSAIRSVGRIGAQLASEEDVYLEPVTASTWLGAVLLDLCGLDPKSFLVGSACIVTGFPELVGPVAEAIRAALPQAVQQGRNHKPSPGHPVVAEDGLILPDWYAAALRRCAPVVAVTATGDAMVPPEAITLAGRLEEIPPAPMNMVLAATVEAATGGRIFVREEDAALVQWSDVDVLIQHGDDHIAAAERIRKLARQRREKPRKGPGPRGKAASSSPAAAPAGDGVTRRLADMEGFGAEARAWGMSLAADLQGYRSGLLPWRDVDRGVLLSGPPGCGKTTFVKALAQECEVELVTTLYSEWSEGNSGDAVSKTLTKLFKTWREKATTGPFILFLDEIDSMGARGSNGHGEHWFRPIINTWLAFLDGAVPRDGIVVIGATNSPDSVDAALCRPGRLERHVAMPAPSGDALAGVLRSHLGPEADLAGLDAAARACRGMSPADIALVVRDARRMARTTFRRPVSADDVRLVLDANRAGHDLDLDRRIAVHEAGHAVALLALGVETFDRVDLDAALTWTVDGVVWTENAAMARLVMLLAGMAAEDVLLGAHSGGCSMDLRAATNLATTIQAGWGMGVTGCTALPAEVAIVDRHVRMAVDRTLAAAHARARALVKQHRDAVARVADALVRQRYLDADEVREVIGTEPDMEVAR